MEIIRPPALSPGNAIGIISPSWFGGKSFVRRANRGISMLESLGYRTVVGEHAFEHAGHISASAADRTSDFHAMIADDDVRMILCTIGGTHASDLLPLLDFDLIRQHPKIVMGFSDITVLLNAIHVETGLVTFYGPALMTDWAEYPSMPAYSRQSALTTLTSTSPIGPLSAPSRWTEEFLDWETGEDEQRSREYRPNNGWHWIRAGSASGRLVGGCLESLQHLRETRWWPNLEGSILFVETSEESESPEEADAILGDYANMGVFDHISGMLVSKPYGYNEAKRERFITYLEARTAPYAFPVVANMDFGHTSPQLTIPIGVGATIDGNHGSVSIDSAAVRRP